MVSTPLLPCIFEKFYILTYSLVHIKAEEGGGATRFMVIVIYSHLNLFFLSLFFFEA